MTVEFGEQIARARQGTGLSEQAFAHFVGDPDAAQEELSELGKVIGAADEAAGQARRRALDALERAQAEFEGLAERERTLKAREEAFARQCPAGLGCCVHGSGQLRTREIR